MISDVFISQIEDLLAHLYDPAYLQRHPAVPLFVAPTDSAVQAGRQARRALLEALDRLDPGPRIPPRSPKKREHSVLKLRYVEQLTVKEIARELDISERQVYRDLSRALANLAALVAEDRGPVPTTFSRDELVAQEARRLLGDFAVVDIASLTEHARDAVASLAETRQVYIDLDIPPHLPTVTTNPHILRQAILVALSYAIQISAPGGKVTLGLSGEGTAILITLEIAIESIPTIDESILESVRALLHEISGDCEITMRRNSSTLRLRIDRSPLLTVLVIDDNAGLADLFRHYLAEDACQIVAAQTAEEGQRIAQECVPDAVVLDILMPGSDGWELLRRLRTVEATRFIAIVVCSVLDDPQLAYSLGADAFVAKPVTAPRLRAALKEALDRSAERTRANS